MIIIKFKFKCFYNLELRLKLFSQNCKLFSQNENILQSKKIKPFSEWKYLDIHRLNKIIQK